MIYKLLGLIFYALFFSWLFLKLRTSSLVKKLNYKEAYKELKKDLKQEPTIKKMSKLTKTIIIILVIYIVIAIILGIFTLIMMFVTLGGAMYVDTGTSPAFYNGLLAFVKIYFSIFKYIPIYIYGIMYLLLIKAVRFNLLSYNKLKNI